MTDAADRRGASLQRVRRSPYAELGVRARSRKGRRGRPLPDAGAYSRFYVRGRRSLGRRLRGARVFANRTAPFCLTVDTAIYSRRGARHRQAPCSGRAPAGRRGREFQAALDWRPVRALRKTIRPSRWRFQRAHRDRRGRQDRARFTASNGSTSPNHGGGSSDHGRAPWTMLPSRDRWRSAAGRARSWSTAVSRAHRTSSRRYGGRQPRRARTPACYALAAGGEARGAAARVARGRG